MDNATIKILAVDDNLDNLITIQALIFESFPDAKVILATRGKEALEIAAAEKPDVILLDIVMPDMDGFEVCSILKSDKHLSNIPVVFVTAIKGDKDSRIRALEVGGEAFLSKPIDQSELVAQIRAMAKIKKSVDDKITENQRLNELVEEKTRQLTENNRGTLNLLEDLSTEIEIRKKIEDSLRESEEQYRLLVENSPNGIAIYQDGVFVYVNQTGLEEIGATTPEDILGKPILSILHPDYQEVAKKRIGMVMSGMAVPPMEEKIIRIDGSVFEAEVIAVATTYNGKPAGQAIVTDISDRKKAEYKLRESEVKFRDMANLLPQVIFEMDLEGKITYVNKQSQLLFGYDIDELMGMNSLLVYIPEERERVLDGMKKKLAKQEVQNKEFQMLRKDGTAFPALIYTNIIEKEDVPVGLRGVIVDMTEQKLAENAIRESEAKYFNLYSLYRLMSDTMPDMMWAKDLEGRFTFTNKSFCENLLNVTDIYEPIGKTGAYFATRERESHLENPQWHTFGDYCDISDQITFNELQKKQFDEYGTVKGKFIYLDVHKAPLFDANNKLVGLVGTARDITERKISEKALEESRKELQTIYDNAPVMLCVIDEERKIQFSNNAFSNLIGFSADDVIGGLFGGVVGCINSLDDPRGCGFGPNCPKCTLRLAIEKSFKTSEGQHNIEYHSTVKLKNEIKEIYLLGSTALIETNNKTNLLLSLHDITDRKAAEDALQKSETMLRTFIDNFPFEIWARDMKGVGILENRKFFEHYGSIIGVTPYDDSRVDKKMIKLWKKINERVYVGETLDEEYEFEVDGTMKDFQQIVFPIKDNEKITGIAGFNIDITARKLAEKALSESQEMLQNFASHLQNVREEERILLAREIHDDLGQILVAMKIDMGMLKQSVIRDIVQEKVPDIVFKFDNLIKLVDTTINATRKIMTDLRPEVLELLGFIEAVKLHLNTFGERYKIKTKFINSVDNLNINPQQEIALFRIIQESLNNVAKHAHASIVSIEFYHNSDKLELIIRDNGIGIDVSKQKRIDSYGLIGMQERVFLLGGNLIIQGEKGKGTTVRIEMPHK